MRDSVFQSVAGEVGAEGETASGRESPEMHDNKAAEIGADDGAGIAERGAVEFAVADGHDFADSVHDGISGGGGELFEFGWGLRLVRGRERLRCAE